MSYFRKLNKNKSKMKPIKSNKEKIHLISNQKSKKKKKIKKIKKIKINYQINKKKVPN